MHWAAPCSDTPTEDSTTKPQRQERVRGAALHRAADSRVSRSRERPRNGIFAHSAEREIAGRARLCPRIGMQVRSAGSRNAQRMVLVPASRGSRSWASDRSSSTLPRRVPPVETSHLSVLEQLWPQPDWVTAAPERPQAEAAS